MAGVLKEMNPDVQIIFLGSDYNKDVIDLSIFVDEFVSWDEIAKLKEEERIEKIKSLNADSIIHVFPRKEIASAFKKANVPMRLGTTNKFYHLFYCNFIMMLSRKNANLHESQLNLKLLKPFGNTHPHSLDDIPKYYGITKLELPDEKITKLLSTTRFNLILHPKSKGNSKEWGLKNFAKLIELIKNDGFQIFITGSEEEGKEIRKVIQFENYNNVIDVTGKFSLKELISFINSCDGIVAGSTGPLHIAAALGKLTLGLYSPVCTINPGRWAPVGNLSSFIVKNKKCSKCRYTKSCECLESITPEAVREKLNSEL